jgi:glycosyltransferase involved in cell wall biosynthesis
MNEPVVHRANGASEYTPLASIVVCAYSSERLQLLKDTIASLQRQTYPYRELVLVIDHNPALEAEMRTLEREGLRVVANAGEKGLADARNTGLKLGQGDIIAFIDDDATADEAWLEELVACYRDPAVIACGGEIRPVWDGGVRPAWMAEEFLWTIGCTYRGMQTGDSVRNVIGCNMSFRSEVFEEVGGFSTSVGRLEHQLLGCEETEICIRALTRWPEKRIAYTPGAIVHHHVARPRQKIGYYTRRCYGEGISKVVVRRLWGAAGTSAEMTYLTRALPRAILNNLRDVVMLRDIPGSLLRIGTIGTGVGAVGAGFAAGMVKHRKTGR